MTEPRDTLTPRRTVVGGLVGAIAVLIVWSLLYDVGEAIVMSAGFFAAMLAAYAWVHRRRR